MYLNIIIAMYNKPIANIILNRTIETISSKVRNNSKVASFFTLIQYNFGIPVRTVRQDEEILKSGSNKEGKSQIIPICS
jgi:hypothetical protein